MDCCGHRHVLTRRRWIWSTLTSVAAMMGGGVEPRGSTPAAQTAETAAAALDVLRNSISVDVHTHGGTTGITSKAPPSGDLAKAMRAGSLAVACVADVPDAPILTRNEAGVLTATRTPEPSALYKYHLERLDWLDEMVATLGLRRALSAADLEAAHSAGQPAIVSDVEGLDFLEKKLEHSRRLIGAASGMSSSCTNGRNLEDVGLSGLASSRISYLVKYGTSAFNS